MTALPSQVELKDLVARQEAIQAQLEAHRDLQARLHTLSEQRKQGNGRMELPVELGPGFSAEGVVEDTSHIILSAGLDDLWLDLPIEKAQGFVESRIGILEMRLKDLEKPIAKLKEEYALVAKTLRDAFQLPSDDTPSS
ncbi:hypothetical protein JCM3765_003935 [Sporobolomyces pararoseus]